MSPTLTDELDKQEAKLLAKGRRIATSGRALYNATSDYKIVKPNIAAELDEAEYQLDQQSGGATSHPEFNASIITVWINTNSGVWHLRHQRWHGNTKDGFLCSVADARKSGYRASANGQ